MTTMNEKQNSYTTQIQNTNTTQHILRGTITMNIMYASITILFLIGMISTSLAYQPRRPLQQNNMPSCSPSDDATRTRRSVVLEEFPAFAAVMMTGMMVTSSSRADALDYDSFMKKELNNEAEKPKMSEDEALCRFGSPSQKTGNACLQAGLSTKRPTGVDAFGTVDRGSFVKCKPNYVEDPKNKGMLINTWSCE